ncbi:aspartate aminotransferase [Aurantiacibacter atlanticus]|uniref:Aminotransferase n=1 Tax=Aurantiacibacter atlanticus TaxID=1648404 RepID=A0A0H4V8M0_9SPHN|nr:pyridoxal phosphate-dependent aminotransferase [Aurantiacibacter atlanticus]AKQ40957.1 aspartate aminotransferase [Aurantiacibacter atlanticus]MDF1834251.1 pyridoxal phosphate-dependent aminotransferase [Alteraurantiacibacter sp. bin_em_oilr2.035]
MTVPPLSHALQRIEASSTSAMTDRARILQADGRDIISLSVGEPDFATPPHVIAAAKDALDAGDTRYTSVMGTTQLREAAALHFRRDLGIAAEAGDVIVTAGGKQAIFEALAATISAGDEVIVPCPWWVSYPQIVRFCGGKVVPLLTHPENGYRFDASDLEALITPKTRWALLNSPGNPTGAVYPEGMLHAIADVLRRHPQVMVLSDDIYAPLSYTGQDHATLAALCPDLKDRVLTVSGVSKSHAMTGFRIGVTTGPRWLLEAMTRLQGNSSGNAASISQAAAVAALAGPQDFLADWRAILRGRRDMMVERLNAIPGLSTPMPDGAFYCLVNAAPIMDRFGRDDNRLALHLLDHGVAVVAVSAFGGRDGFRISFAASEESLRTAMDRIEKALIGQ